MFQFTSDEKVVGYEGPVGLGNGLQGCSECGQVAFRVLHVKSQVGQREVPLCGAHFTEACALYPEVRRAAGMRAAI
jgi:hypothetical protein